MQHVGATQKLREHIWAQEPLLKSFWYVTVSAISKRASSPICHHLHSTQDFLLIWVAGVCQANFSSRLISDMGHTGTTLSV